MELFLRWGLAGVFVWAGIVKLLDVRGFAEGIAKYHLLPDQFLAWTAWGLPALEVLVGLGLALGVRSSLGLATALLALFAGTLWLGILRGLDMDCGCFSPVEQAEHDGLRMAFWRDLVMLASALWLHWQAHSRAGRGTCLQSSSEQRLRATGN